MDHARRSPQQGSQYFFLLAKNSHDGTPVHAKWPWQLSWLGEPCFCNKGPSKYGSRARLPDSKASSMYMISPAWGQCCITPCEAIPTSTPQDLQKGPSTGSCSHPSLPEAITMDQIRTASGLETIGCYTPKLDRNGLMGYRLPRVSEELAAVVVRDGLRAL